MKAFGQSDLGLQPQSIQFTGAGSPHEPQIPDSCNLKMAVFEWGHASKFEIECSAIPGFKYSEKQTDSGNSRFLGKTCPGLHGVYDYITERKFERQTMSESAGIIDWTAALQQHRPWLMKVLRCRVNDAHVIEDMYQNIALAVVKQSAKPDDPEKVAPWLYRLAVRQTINHHRKSHRRMHSLDTPDDEMEPTVSNPLDWIMEKESRGEVQEAMTRLNPREREILTLKYSENWSYADLARHLGVKVNTVEYRLMKARKQLRTLLTKTIVQPIRSAK